MEIDPSLTPPLRYGIFHMFRRFFFESFPNESRVLFNPILDFKFFQYVFIVLYSMIIMTGITGNLMVIFTVIRYNLNNIKQ